MLFEPQGSTEHTVKDLDVLPQDCTRYAVLVGTSNNSRNNIGFLPGVSNDVDLVYKLLIDDCYGFEKDNVKVLKNEPQYPSPERESIWEELDKTLAGCKPNDFIFLYFAGHGFYDSDNKEDFYVPFDVKTVNKVGDKRVYDSKECFSLKDLRTKLEDCQAKFKLVVVDACRVKYMSSRYFNFADKYKEKLNAKLENTGGSLWFQSCEIGHESYEDSFETIEYGLFTWYFCEGARKAPTDRYGRISPEGLFNYAKGEVLKHCDKNKQRFPKPQNPQFFCPENFDCQFAFVSLDAEGVYNEASHLLSEARYNEALVKIDEALRLDPTNEKYKILKKQCETLSKVGKLSKIQRFLYNILPIGGSNVVEIQGENLTKVSSEVRFPDDYCDPKGKEYRLIRAGKFIMGSPLTGKQVVAKYTTPNNPQFYDDALRHYVTLTKDFYLAKHPVTKGDFRLFIDATGYKTTAERKGSAWIFSNSGDWKDVKGKSWLDPGFEQTDEHPVVCVSYYDAQEYVAWLNEEACKNRSEINGFMPFYRLPTEAEWEYACRAGTKWEFFWGTYEKGGKGFLNAAGTENNPSGKKWNYRFPFDTGYPATSPVGSFKPNPWGLYDMLGNVWEWTSDWYGQYPKRDVTDPKGPSKGSCRVLRGGSWNSFPAVCRCASRHCDAPEIRDADSGFRVAFSLTSK